MNNRIILLIKLIVYGYILVDDIGVTQQQMGNISNMLKLNGNPTLKTDTNGSNTGLVLKSEVKPVINAHSVQISEPVSIPTANPQIAVYKETAPTTSTTNAFVISSKEFLKPSSSSNNKPKDAKSKNAKPKDNKPNKNKPKDNNDNDNQDKLNDDSDNDNQDKLNDNKPNDNNPNDNNPNDNQDKLNDDDQDKKTPNEKSLDKKTPNEKSLDKKRNEIEIDSMSEIEDNYKWLENKKSKKKNRKLHLPKLKDLILESEEEEESITSALDPEDINIKLVRDIGKKYKSSFNIHHDKDYHKLIKDEHEERLFDDYKLKPKSHFEDLDDFHNRKIESADEARERYINSKIKNSKIKSKNLKDLYERLKKLFDLLDTKYETVNTVLSNIKNHQSQMEGEMENRKKSAEDVKLSLKEIESRSRLSENEIYNLTKRLEKEKSNLSKYRDQVYLLSKQNKENQRKSAATVRDHLLNNDELKEYSRVKQSIQSDRDLVEEKITDVSKRIEELERGISKLEIQRNGIDGDGRIPLYAKYEN